MNSQPLDLYQHQKPIKSFNQPTTPSHFNYAGLRFKKKILVPKFLKNLCETCYQNGSPKMIPDWSRPYTCNIKQPQKAFKKKTPNDLIFFINFQFFDGKNAKKKLCSKIEFPCNSLSDLE